MRRSQLGIVLVVSIALVACGGGDDDAVTSTSGSSPPATTTAVSSPDTAAAVSTTAAPGVAVTTGAVTSEASSSAAPERGPGTPAPRPLATRTKVVIAVAALAENYAGLMLAKEFGEFEKENIDAEIQVLNLVDAQVLLTQGTVQLQGASITAAFLNANDQQDTLRCGGYMYDQTSAAQDGIWIGNDYVNEDGTPDPAKVKGMTLNAGVSGLGSPTIIAFERFLSSVNLGFDDVTFANLGQADAVIALEQGAIGGSYLQAPFWQEVADSATYVDGTLLHGACYVMTSKFMAEQPEVAEALLRALLRTHRTYLRDDYHENAAVVTTLAAAMGVPEETLSGSDTTFRFTDDLVSQQSIADGLEMQEAWLRVGDILAYSEPIPRERLIDLSIAERVVADA